MALRLCGPELRHGEARVQVRAEVVHPPDGEGEVHAELWGVRDGTGEGKMGEGREADFEDFEIGAAEGAEEGVEHGWRAGQQRTCIVQPCQNAPL